MSTPDRPVLERRHSQRQLLAITVCRWIALVAITIAVAATLLAALVLPWFLVN